MTQSIFSDIGTLAAIVFPIIGVAFTLGWATRSVHGFLLKQSIKSLTDRVVWLQTEDRDRRFEIEQLQAQIRKFETAPPSDESDLATFNLIRDAVTRNENSLWTLRAEDLKSSKPIRRPDSPPVISMTNLKGGVGKTTTTVNLGAFLCKAKGARVLFVDADYQGSLTNNLINAAGINDPKPQTAPWLRFDREPCEILSTAVDIDKVLPGCALIGSGYRLNEDENRSFVQWLIGQSVGDVRFRLANFLWSPEVAKRFDYVLIDAPPRLGTAGINALCASSHFAIPTLMTTTSTEPIEQMLVFFRETFKELNPELKLTGVIANQTYRSGIIAREKSIIDDINLRLSSYTRAQVFRRNIRLSPDILRESGKMIPYLNHADVRQAFDELGEEMLQSIRRPISVAA